ncbi:MAG: cysteine synthase family protein [Clostridiales bacterium]|nr:cysteine synthase family protein [Clostridiales bacterium]
MEYLNSIKDMIGNTPILKITNFDLPANVNLYAKLEMYNPLGSVKDRIGSYLIGDAVRNGLKPGGTIILATAGNTGIGTAVAALGSNYRLIVVVPDKFSREKQALMRALGAEIINTPRADGMLGAERKAEELAKEIEGSVIINQFESEGNPRAHYETTGPEIYRQMDGKIDYFVAGAGSGGTFSGVLKYLKEKDPSIKGVLADPYGSIIGGGEHADYDIEGIGNDFIAATMNTDYIDEVVKITDEEAFNMAKELAKREGVIGGSSTGAALTAALRFAKTLQDQEREYNIVTLFPDSGERYHSKNLL